MRDFITTNTVAREREFFMVNLLVRIHFIIVMIRWTGLAQWEFESPFPGGLTSTFLFLSTFLHGRHICTPTEVSERHVLPWDGSLFPPLSVKRLRVPSWRCGLRVWGEGELVVVSSLRFEVWGLGSRVGLRVWSLGGGGRGGWNLGFEVWNGWGTI